MNGVNGFTAGAWDLLHAGHVHFLSKCKKRCDVLIVGLHTNPQIDRPHKNKPVQSVYERYSQLIGLKAVDSVIPYDTEQDLINLLACENIAVRFLGSEYRGKIFTGTSVCNIRGIGIEYIERLHTYSSTELRNRIER